MTTNQPPDTVALRALAERVQQWCDNRQTSTWQDICSDIATLTVAGLAYADTADRHAALVVAVRDAFTFIWSDTDQAEGILQNALDAEEETRMSPEALETTKLKEEFESLEWFAKEALTEQAMDCEQRLSDQAKAYEQSLLEKAREHARLHDRHASLCVAILAGRWDEAARLAKGGE